MPVGHRCSTGIVGWRVSYRHHVKRGYCCTERLRLVHPSAGRSVSLVFISVVVVVVVVVDDAVVVSNGLLLRLEPVPLIAPPVTVGVLTCYSGIHQ